MALSFWRNYNVHFIILLIQHMDLFFHMGLFLFFSGDIIMTGEGHKDWLSDCDFHPGYDT